MLDPAWMLLHMGHLTAEDEMRRVFATLHSDNHHPFGGPPTIQVGNAPHLLWWPQEDPIEILRIRPQPIVL